MVAYPGEWCTAPQKADAPATSGEIAGKPDHAHRRVVGTVLVSLGQRLLKLASAAGHNDCLLEHGVPHLSLACGISSSLPRSQLGQARLAPRLGLGAGIEAVRIGPLPARAD